MPATSLPGATRRTSMTRNRIYRAIRWALAGLLAASTILPLHRLLDPSRTGAAGQATRRALESLFPSAWVATAGLFLLAGALTWLGAGERTLGWLHAAADLVRPIEGRVWAAGCGLVATSGAGAVTGWLLRGRTTLIDEMAQLRHARLLAQGRLAEAWPFDEAFRSIQNGLFTGEGWVSIYPPGHTALLAAGLRTGLHPWTGPLLTGVAGVFTALILLRLWPARPATARLAGLAAACSPFLWGLGAGSLSHVAALAGVTVTLWATLRARDGSPGWAGVAGLAAGWTVAARPWMGMGLTLLLPAGLLFAAWREAERPWAWVATRLSLAALGGLPFALALAAFNSRLFTDGATLGYSVAFGPSHGLGFHTDPWGNVYGLREALAYTGADIAQLGTRLLETPISLVLVVAVWLFMTPRLPRGSVPLMVWALLPVAANAAYWHHGIHRGPRMLLEASPAWIALVILALAQGTTAPANRRVRAGVSMLVVLSVGWAAGAAIPARLASWSLPEPEVLPTPPDGPAIVFVHGSWASREAERLSGLGVRRDSVETALRRNDLCQLHRAARAGGSSGTTWHRDLDLDPAPGSPDALQPVRLSPGNVALLRDPRNLTADCLREARADRAGVTPLAPILARVAPWSPDVPVVWVRDLGPEENRALVEAMPDRSAWVWGTDAGLEEFEEGMSRIWGEGDRAQEVEGVSGR